MHADEKYLKEIIVLSTNVFLILFDYLAFLDPLLPVSILLVAGSTTERKGDWE